MLLVFNQIKLINVPRHITETKKSGEAVRQQVKREKISREIKVGTYISTISTSFKMLFSDKEPKPPSVRLTGMQMADRLPV